MSILLIDNLWGKTNQYWVKLNNTTSMVNNSLALYN